MFVCACAFQLELYAQVLTVVRVVWLAGGGQTRCLMGFLSFSCSRPLMTVVVVYSVVGSIKVIVIRNPITYLTILLSKKGKLDTSSLEMFIFMCMFLCPALHMWCPGCNCHFIYLFFVKKCLIKLFGLKKDKLTVAKCFRINFIRLQILLVQILPLSSELESVFAL